MQLLYWTRKSCKR